MKKQADPDDDREARRPGGQHEVGDDRRTRLRARVDRFDADEGAQRPVEQPHRGGGHDRDRRADAGQRPGVARRAVPQLGDEVGERHDDERQRRVVVVLEGGPVDAGPRDPLGRERRWR